MVTTLAAGRADVNATFRQQPVGEFVGGRPLAYVDSALIAAVKTGSVPMVGALLRAGADPKFKDSEGKTALDRAREANNADLAALLAK